MKGDASGAEVAREGLFASLKGLFGTSLSLLENRLQLFGAELAEERLRVLSLLAYGAIAFICLGAGMVFLAMFFTVLMWDSNRLLVLGVFSALFLASGALTLVLALNRAKAGSVLFSGSLSELRRDREALSGSRSVDPQ